MLQQQFEKNQSQKSPQWLAKLRQAKFDFYQTQGLPTVSDENWKYTNVKPIAKKEFRLGKPNEKFSPLRFTKDLEAVNVFVVNGHFHSMFNSDVEGLIIKSLRSAIQEKLPAIKKLNQQADKIKHGFATLNTAFINDGIYLHLTKKTVLEKPIHIFYINTDSESVQYHRNLFIAESCSEAVIIEHYLSDNSESYYSNSISEVYLEPSAVLNHIKIQQEAESAYHIATIKVQQSANTVFNNYTVSLGGKLSRSDIEIALTEQGASCGQYGLYLGHNRQHFDHHTYVGHEVPHCTSRQLYKGVLDNAARAVFNGKVYVYPNAVKSDSTQMNKNLLLSDKAEIDTKPELEIYNDDVLCSHGATVGQLDETQLFYLLSRGLDKSTAESLLIYAFSCEVISSIKNKALYEYLRNMILQKLPAGEAVKELLK